MYKQLCALLATGLLFAPTPGLAGLASEHLAAAVRFATISHQDSSKLDAAAFSGLHDFLRQTYPLTFAQLEVEVINDYSLMLVWAGSDDTLEPVLFTAHIDVVPIEPGTEDGWDHPPFAGVIADGVIYGRGTMDDKVGVISLLEASERLLAQGFSPRRGLVLAFGHDEEVSGANGAGRIAARMKQRGMHFSWMVDEGGFITLDHPMLPQRPVVVINVAEKGYYTLKLTATGVGGHSSMPPAHTSIGKLAAALTRIENNPFPTRLEEPLATMLQRLAPHLEFPNSLVFSNLWLTAPLVINGMTEDRTTNAMVRTTTAVTVFTGGVKENVVPQKAEALVNFRLLPGDTPQMVLARIVELVDDPDITVAALRQEPALPPVADMDGSGFEVISAAAQAVYPNAVAVPSLLMGATDIRHYIDLADNHYRFHGVAVELADVAGIHGTNERLRVESFEKAVDIAVKMMELGSQ